MSRITHQQCPVCESSELHAFMTVRDHSISGEDFPVAKCSSCGLAITQEAPDEASIGPYYESDEYISHSDTREGLINRLYHIARDFMLGSKRRTVASVAPPGKPRTLVDYGAGTGYFLDHMKRSGWQVTGVEPSDSGREFASRSFGIEVLAPEDFYSDFQSEVSVVSMWHVLEHVHDLEACLKKMHSILSEKGALVIAVPNHVSPDGGHYGDHWAAYDVPRHLWHFTPESMKLLVEKQGFSLERMKTMPLDAFYVSLLSEKYRGNKLAIVGGFLQGLRSWIAGAFATGRSSSVIYLFRKV